jgi:uncharacterized protein YndB with AHSA1/START domain
VPIIDITSDPDRLTLTVVGEYAVPVERLWDAWTDPRQIERFWGPPGWPATFTRHDMVVGGRSHYFMTGPDGERAAGYWIVERIDHERGFEIVDGFARDDDGAADDALPTMRMQVSFDRHGDGSRLTAVTTFPDLPAMEKILSMGILSMGMVEGVTGALGQMDDVLADLASFAAGGGTETFLVGDTRARICRVVRGSVEQVWDAHHDAALMQRWMLGPDGWTMPVSVVARGVGDRFRDEWESDDGEHRFGFEGELLESHAPRRSVTTERMIGTDGPMTTNEMTLTPIAGGTLLSVVVTYPDRAARDEILATGMTDGMERSYQRLEAQVLAPTG